MRIVRLRDSAAYGASDLAAITTCHTLWIGSDSGTAQSDAVLSGVTVESIEYRLCTTAVDRLADSNARAVFRNAAGRWYHLSKNTSPRAYGQHIAEGTYTGYEIRAI
jgi:hypothetical protein